MSWIKLDVGTPDKIEVFTIATQLGIERTDALGRLVLIWRWFDQHTESGNAARVTDAFLDRQAEMPGFAKAMRAAGWLADDPEREGGVCLPNFERHNGETAKSRALTAKRVQAHRTRRSNERVTAGALPREEKKKEEKFLPLPPGQPAADLFEIASSLYPKRPGNDPDSIARRSWSKRIQEGVKPEAMIEGVKRYAVYCAATKKTGTDFVMQRATFFGDDTPFERDFKIETPSAPAVDMEAWWKSNEGITQKGIEIGHPWPPKSQQLPGWFHGYKLKVFELAGRGPWIELVPERLRPQLEEAWAEAE